MLYKERRAGPALAGLVAGYWLFEGGNELALFQDYAWPEVNGSMIVTLSGSYRGTRGACPGCLAVGGLREAVEIRMHRRPRLIGLRFRPGGMRALLGVSPAEIGGIERLSGAWVRELEERLAACAPADEKAAFACVEAALSRRLSSGAGTAGAHPSKSYPCPLCARVGDCATLCGRSLRSLQRDMRWLSGYSPSEYRAVARCELARDALFRRSFTSLADLALDLGYCDLPHFCKSFKRWTGFTPEGYADFTAPYHGLFSDWNRAIVPFERQEASIP